MTTPATDAADYAAAYAERFPDLDVLELADPLSAFPDLYDDPGAELVDVGELGLTEADLTPTLMAPAALVADVSRIEYAADYVWCTWLADELRAVGLTVVEHPGWKTRGRPRSVGRFQPHGVLWHEDGSTIGPSPYVAKFIAEQGRPEEGIPAPLSQLWICMGCKGAHPVGTVHVLAAGRANHGGTGQGWGAIPQDAANATTIGIETDNTNGEATPPAMYRALVVATAAILRKLRATPARLLAGHKEYAKGRKVDPDSIVMSTGRADVAVEMLRQEGHAAPEPREYARYIVKKGDTIASVAKAYHCTAANLLLWNKPVIDQTAAAHRRRGSAHYGVKTVIWPGTVLTIYTDLPGQRGVKLG